MIFVTVGTENFQFDRLLRMIDEGVARRLIKDDIFVQIGTTDYKPTSFKFIRFLAFNQMVEKITGADIVVSHAGVGSVLLSLSLGKIPIIIPRQKKFGEHLDDHQCEFARMMKRGKRVICVEDENDFFRALSEYRNIVLGLKYASESSRDILVRYFKDEM